MTYTVGTPFDGQSLSNSKPQIRSNFTVINTAFSVNHLALGAVDQGKHKFLQMPNQSPAPSPPPSTSAAESGFYAKSAQSFSNLFWRQESGGADPLKNQGAEIQLTNITPLSVSNGHSFLPGGLLIQWGSTTTDSSGTKANINFPVAFSSTAYVVNVTADTASLTLTGLQTLVVANVTASKFDLRSFAYPTGRTVYFIAIGPKA